ncbi:glycerophosphoinositol permease [Saguinus oedipus]|uniref:Glycerophosphoinositol permease n=1 Tax=Saguinus oedipus TaxID=9490 RepID=A0ABQ9UZU1_SAGOE|nr:glycerophosphoinositol permease [Saguinus oedipus]
MDRAQALKIHKLTDVQIKTRQQEKQNYLLVEDINKGIIKVVDSIEISFTDSLYGSQPTFNHLPHGFEWLQDARASRLEKQNSTPESDYDNTPNDMEPDGMGYICRTYTPREGLPRARDLAGLGQQKQSSRKGRQRSMVWPGDGLVPDTAEPHMAPSLTLPSTEDVIRKTEQITKNIQELLRAAQENKHDRSKAADTKVVRNINICPEAISGFKDAIWYLKPKSDMVRTSLRLLTSSAYRLQSECKKTLPGDPGSPTDVQLVTQQVIQCAYDIAKAAKQLVTITTKENNN